MRCLCYVFVYVDGKEDVTVPGRSVAGPSWRSRLAGCPWPGGSDWPGLQSSKSE